MSATTDTIPALPDSPLFEDPIDTDLVADEPEYGEPLKAAPVEYFPRPILHPDEQYTDSDRAAVVAHANEHSYAQSVRYLKKNLRARYQVGENELVDCLERVMENTRTAVTTLTGIGYTNFRHLQSAGFTLHEIANKLHLNVLDLIAYMSAHPDAESHAELDTTSCADAKFMALVDNIKTAIPRSKFEADRLRTEATATESLVRRLSADWVGQYRNGIGGENGLPAGNGLAITMNIGGGNQVQAPDIEVSVGGSGKQLTINHNTGQLDIINNIEEADFDIIETGE